MQNAIPKLESFLKLHSSEPIRNRATFGGNIVNASPIGDMTIFLLALDAKLVLTKGTSERTVSLKSFYTSYKQFDLQKNELIKYIVFPKQLTCRFNFEKVSRRTYLDIASVNSAMSVAIENEAIKQIHISAGGIAPYPFFLKNTCMQLSGELINIETLNTANNSAKEEISPISDMRGSAEYKSLLLQKLIQAHFLEIFPDKIKAQDVI
jgi:xanthine dehydrogenase small subunit